MTARPRARDFTVGETVKVVGPFASNYAHLRQFIGWIGVVQEPIYGKRLVRVGFGPRDDFHFQAKTLERGRVEWIPEGAER